VSIWQSFPFRPFFFSRGGVKPCLLLLRPLNGLLNQTHLTIFDDECGQNAKSLVRQTETLVNILPNPTWRAQGLNPGRRDGKPTSNCPSYGTTHCLSDLTFVHEILEAQVFHGRRHKISVLNGSGISAGVLVKWALCLTNWALLYDVIDRLCSLVVRVPSCRPRGLGFNSRHYQIVWVVVVLERVPLSLVRKNEELLERKGSNSGLENRD
jgi:hypothetical protein